MAGVWGMNWGWREGLAGMQETRLKATAGILGKAGLGRRDGTDEGKGGNQG